MTQDDPRPVITPSRPVITPSRPVITPSRPVITPSRPVVTPSRPVVTPSRPVVTPSRPVVTPSRPVITYFMQQYRSLTPKQSILSFILLYFYTFILFRKFGQIWKKVCTFNMAFRQIYMSNFRPMSVWMNNLSMN